MTDLDFFRSQIDEIDKNILELLADRSNLVRKIWEYKKKNKMPAFQPDRCKEILKSRKALAKELGLKENFVEKIWNEIHNYFLELQKSK